MHHAGVLKHAPDIGVRRSPARRLRVSSRTVGTLDLGMARSFGNHQDAEPVRRGTVKCGATLSTDGE